MLSEQEKQRAESILQQAEDKAHLEEKARAKAELVLPQYADFRVSAFVSFAATPLQVLTNGHLRLEF